MTRTVRTAALAVTFILGLSLAGMAQHDYDDGYYRGGDQNQARQYGYQNGYRDGVARGREEGLENDRFDYRTPDGRQSLRGYEGWMGPAGAFQRGYQEGYRLGLSSGYDAVSNRRGDHDHDADDRGYSGLWGYGDGRFSSPAYNIGYQDGAQVAREDIQNGKRFNSTPRSRYDDRDHGYRREYGSKDRYKSIYTDGYRAGYEANYRDPYYGRY
jgi:hypothetical protein